MIIVNGASGEIGQAIVAAYKDSDMEIIGIGRNEKKLIEMQLHFNNFTSFKIADIVSQEELDRFLSFLQLKLVAGQNILGYVHSVAEFTRFQDPLDISLSDLRSSIETNFIGTFIWNQAILKLMKTSGAGSIVNIISQAWKTGGFSPIGPYAASKGAIVSMSVNFAKLLGKNGLRVNCVSPGYVDSPMMKRGLPESSIHILETQIPLQRFALPSEVASACKFLMSPDASYITGAVIDVSGGLTYP